MNINKLNVCYNGREVGTLVLTNENKIAFQYSKEWIKNGFSISPFSLPLIDKIFVDTKPYFHNLFGVFNDSFVDNWGELVIQRYLKEKGIDYNQLNILDKLSIIGSSTLGGLTYYPSEEDELLNLEKSFDEVQCEINNLYNNEEIKDIKTLFNFGAFCGGNRPKIAAKVEQKDVIIKFRIKSETNDLCLKEYLYSKYASKLGINVPYVNLIKGKELNHFLIERFDLQNGQRKFVISASGLLECDNNSQSLDYLDLLKLTNILTRDKNDILEMYRRMVFNVVFDNLDDHAKNFSFIYDDENKKYRLAPAYDLTPSSTSFGGHMTSVNHKVTNITKEDMLEVAQKSNIKAGFAQEIVEKAYKLKEDFANIFEIMGEL